MKKTFFSTHATGKVFLWAVALPQILAFVAQLLLILFAPLFGQTAEQILGLTPVQIFFAMLAQASFLIILLVLSKKYDLKEAIKIRTNIGWQNAIICVFIGALGVFALSPIVEHFSLFLQSIGFNLSGLAFSVDTPFLLVLALIFMAFVPAVLEEFIFRGVVLQGLKKYGKWVAIFGTSALFVLVHASLQQIIYPFILSIILCRMVLKTDSILCATLTHFVSNGLTLVLSYVGFSLALPLWAAILVAVVGTAVMFGLTYLLKSVSPPKSGEEVLASLPERAPNFPQDSARALRLAIGLGIALYVLSIWVGFMPPSA